MTLVKLQSLGFYSSDNLIDSAWTALNFGLEEAIGLTGNCYRGNEDERDVKLEYLVPLWEEAFYFFFFFSNIR